MKPTTITILALLAFAAGCASPSSSSFRPQWLSDPEHQVVYSFQGEGKLRIRVKAKVTESEFAAATKQLKMIPLSADKDSADNLEGLRWKKGPDKQWDPSQAVDTTLLCHRDYWWETAKYENGFLYYQLLEIDKAVAQPGAQTAPTPEKK